MTIPLFILLSLLLVYALSWFTYLALAQADAPAAQSRFSRFLPFLPYSPLRCLKVSWASLLYSSTAARLVLPAILDWSYRRVMVLGTTAGAAVVKEGILYGPPESDRRLDVYIPPARHGSSSGTGSRPKATEKEATVPLSKRHRKHSTLFDEPPPAVGPDGLPTLNEDAPSGTRTPNRQSQGAAVLVFLPSTIRPITWTSKRKTYLQLALRLRRMGYCVVVPDIAYFPEARVRESIIDVRFALRWVGDNIARYGGDPDRIHLMGHGLSAHLALLTVTQEAVVLSREGIMEAQAYRDQQKAAIEERWQREEDERRRYTTTTLARDRSPELVAASPPKKTKVAGQTWPTTSSAHQRANTADSNAWVDEPTSVEEATSQSGLGPGIVLPATTQFRTRRGKAQDLSDVSTDKATQRLARQLDALQDVSQDGQLDSEVGGRTVPPSPAGAASSVADSYAQRAQRNTLSFPNTPEGNQGRRARYLSLRRARQMEDSDDDLLDIPIPNGLKRVEIYEPEVDVPPIAGLILFSGVSDVIKGFRNETERGVEDLSVLRRSCGPSHTACLLHSPAHLLYAAKNLLDPTLLPPKILLVHGGQDAVVPIEQSTLLKTLLVGIGVSHVRLRAYRKLGHVESVACLFLGMNKSLKRYLKMICQDLDDFLAA